MSDDNASSPAIVGDDTPTAHPTTGGKSLAAIERPRYKSWRKKYRKMHADFNNKYETNRAFFKEEQRLESIAKRLREEINGLMEICLDLNQNPSIPPELRFDVSVPNPIQRVSTNDVWIRPNITPEEANAEMQNYNDAMRRGSALPVEVSKIRSKIEERLAAQGVNALGTLEKRVSQPVNNKADVDVEHDLSFLPFELEMDYLTRLDAKISLHSGLPINPRHRDIEQEKHYADLTPRELERKTEFENPQSQHNWLKTHTKVLGPEAGDGDDTESLASHDPSGPSTAKKRGGGKGVGKGNLAKQVGDRAMEKARDGSLAAGASNDEDELASDAGGLGGSASGRKRQRYPDGTYRLKGAPGATKGAGRGKRKRTGEDLPEGGGAAGGKKAKVEGGSGVRTPTAATAGSGDMNGNGNGMGSGAMGLG